MKVERALSLLPPLEVMSPVRALLLRSGVPDHNDAVLTGTNVALGKREVAPLELRERMAHELHDITAHYAGLYDAYFRALGALEDANAEGAVAHLLGAGQREERADRVVQAHGWYTVALQVADGLADRRPEIRTLLAIGNLSTRLGYFDDATRRYRRALVLAESEFDQESVIAACEGMGTQLVKQGVWSGAEAWYSRALRLAEASDDARQLGMIYLGLGDLSRRRGDTIAAGDALRNAREKFEPLGDAQGMARTLTVQGMLDADLKHSARATSAYREALAWVQRTGDGDALDVIIRINLATLHIEDGRFLDAEKEIRRAERRSAAHSLTRRLVQVYSLLGRLRGRQGDETGFVFFEQALQLARMLERRPIVEAQVYREYGAFKLLMRQADVAHSYLERAREIFESVGASAELEAVMADLHRASA